VGVRGNPHLLNCPSYAVCRLIGGGCTTTRQTGDGIVSKEKLKRKNTVDETLGALTPHLPHLVTPLRLIYGL
jgi:hypothetical protein